jgi:hypothetical protein
MAEEQTLHDKVAMVIYGVLRAAQYRETDLVLIAHAAAGNLEDLDMIQDGQPDKEFTLDFGLGQLYTGGELYTWDMMVPVSNEGWVSGPCPPG